MKIVLASITFLLSTIILSFGIVELILWNPWCLFDIPAGMIGLILTYDEIFGTDIDDQ